MRLKSGEALPFLYGACYYDYNRMELISYLIPFNKIIAYARKFYYFLGDSIGPGWRDQYYRKLNENNIQINQMIKLQEENDTMRKELHSLRPLAQKYINSLIKD